MTDLVLTETVATEVVETSSSVTTVTTTGDTASLVLTTETEIVLNTSQMVPTILTEGVQGPAGPAGTGTSTLSLEAGETLLLGDPVFVNANKLFKASNLLATGVIGLVTTASVIAGFATATIAGVVPHSGLTPGVVYFLGAGVITDIPPSIGYIIRVGKAVSANSLILNIEEPVLLA